MAMTWEAFEAKFDALLPEGSPRRKLVQLLAIVLLFEGISVIIMFSKAGLAAGIFSLALGVFLLIMLRPGEKASDEAAMRRRIAAVSKKPPPGIMLVDWFMDLVRSDYVVMAIGGVIITSVMVFNFFFSNLPEIGDVDTLAILFGGILIVYPFLVPKYKVEGAFTMLFLGLIVVLLVIPQAVNAINTSTGESVGGWYVHYMLAAPFAWILDAIGIPAMSIDNMVMITFQDGTEQWLSISAYCAGLYSFSIFVSAFIAFVLVFERLPAKLMAIVLAIGLVAAYVGNLVRMTVIGVVGYYEGLDALLWAHQNAGWIIFLAWSSVFWYLVIRFADSRAGRAPPVGKVEGNDS